MEGIGKFMYKNLRSSKDNNILLHVANYKDLEIHKKKKKYLRQLFMLSVEEAHLFHFSSKPFDHFSNFSHFIEQSWNWNLQERNFAKITLILLSYWTR